MRASFQKNSEREQEDTLSQLNRWLEEYRQLAEQKEHESFQLKLQIAQLYETIRTKDIQEANQQSYIVDLEETVRALGDELDNLRGQLAGKDKEIKRLRSLIQLSKDISPNELTYEHNDDEEYNHLLSEALALHEENARLTQRMGQLEEKVNNKESQCIDMRIRIQELEVALRNQGISLQDVHLSSAAPSREPALMGGDLGANSEKETDVGTAKLSLEDDPVSPNRSIFRHASSDEDDPKSPVINR